MNSRQRRKMARASLFAKANRQRRANKGVALLRLAEIELVLLALVLAGLLYQPKEVRYMPIELDGATTHQRITFGFLPAVTNLGQISVCEWVWQDTYIATAPVLGIFVANEVTDDFWLVTLNRAANGKLSFTKNWSGNNGIWDTTAADVPTAGLHHYCITYDSGATANDPVIYVDGVSVGVTEITAPTGAIVTGTGGSMNFGGVYGSAPIDGRVWDGRVYNRILTAADALEMYLSKCYDSVPRGLIFQARGYGAAGGVLSGQTLATANTLSDFISGALGQPVGSPVVVDDAYLNCQP